MPHILELLKNRIDLNGIAFTDRHSRIMVFYRDNIIQIYTAETWLGIDPHPTVTLQIYGEDRQPITFDPLTLPHFVEFMHGAQSYGMVFADPETLLMNLPAGVRYIRLRILAETLKMTRRGGLCTSGERTIAYTTNADMKQSTETIVDDYYSLSIELRSSSEIALQFHITRTKSINRYIPSFTKTVDEAKKRWEQWFDAVPVVPEAYQEHYYLAWWILGINRIRPSFHPQREGIAPSKLGYMGIWNWDSYFHAIALRHTDMHLAQEQFRLFFDHQLANGMLPDVIHDDGIISHTTDRFEADITKPPLTAWAIWKLFEIDGDREFLQEVYDPLVRSQEWWLTEQDTDGNGLCEYQHPYSAGLDDSPLFDDGVPVESPDLSAYLILQYDVLAKIANEIGLPRDAERWTRRARELTQHLIDLRWDESRGIFTAWHNNQLVDVTTPFQLFPLITGRMPDTIAQKLVETLTDENKFWTTHPVPTVAYDDPKYDAMQMWRGPVWVNINYLLIDGLQRAGFEDVAQELRRKTIAMIQAHGNIFEYYNPQTGEKPPKAVAMFSWGSACLIDLILQEIGS